jgi:hypothetical protein
MSDWSLPSRISYALWRGDYVSARARTCAFWHYVCRGYDAETCGECGRPVGLVWSADDAVWVDLMGGGGGIRCVPCFDRQLVGQGHFVRWRPELGI